MIIRTCCSFTAYCSRVSALYSQLDTRTPLHIVRKEPLFFGILFFSGHSLTASLMIDASCMTTYNFSSNSLRSSLSSIYIEDDFLPQDQLIFSNSLSICRVYFFFTSISLHRNLFDKSP